eukprot:COSAG03_NODE_639_length_6562_cov_16.796844_2_plen_74_part_00
MADAQQRRLAALGAALPTPLGTAASTEATEATVAVSMDELVEEYARQNPTSKAWFDRAQASLPMGNSRTGAPH